MREAQDCSGSVSQRPSKVRFSKTTQDAGLSHDRPGRLSLSQTPTESADDGIAGRLSDSAELHFGILTVYQFSCVVWNLRRADTPYYADNLALSAGPRREGHPWQEFRVWFACEGGEFWMVRGTALTRRTRRTELARLVRLANYAR